MDGKERNRLNGGFSIRNAQQRGPEHRQEAEKENRNCQVYVRRGRANRSAPQQQRNAKQGEDCARVP